MDTGRIGQVARRHAVRAGLFAVLLLLAWRWPSSGPIYFVVAVAILLVPAFPVLASSVVALVASLAYVGVLDPGLAVLGGGVVWLLLLLAAGYSCMRRRPGWWWLLPFLLATAPAFLGFTLWPPIAPMCVAVGVVAGISRNHGLQAVALHRQVAVQEQLTRFLRIEQVGLEQRQELARELHDIVGHHVTAIVVLAEAAQARPDAQATALPRIADTARAALTELDTLVAALRTPGAEAQTSATRGLADLDELAGPLRDAGVVISVQTKGASGLSQGLQSSAYRIVQEALTNVLRHARASHVNVTVTQDAGQLAVIVDDDGSGLGSRENGEGRGLLGIAERASGHGGTWSIGERPGGGTRVRVDLPVRPRRRWGAAT
jgi:signal transduction histidine kinase